jgi:hypothetical protein
VPERKAVRVIMEILIAIEEGWALPREGSQSPSLQGNWV